MEMRLVRLVITGLILSGFVFTLSGCVGGEGVWHRTEIRNLPDELEAKLSIGDTRQKVRTMLGEPFLDARSLGLEVYRKAGRDLDYWWAYLPIFTVPAPGQKIVVYVLVAYDEHAIVKEVTTDFWIHGHGVDFWSTAGGYSFVSSYYNEPETILGPPVTWEEMARMPGPEEECTLILLMGECPMEEVSLDKSHIIDLSPAGRYCGFDTWEVRDHNFYGAFIRKDITPGGHRLDISQITHHGNFGANFTCEPGETVFAELKASNPVPDTWPIQLQGTVSISKNPSSNLLDIDVLHPIIWHQGKWYGSVTNPAVGN